MANPPPPNHAVDLPKDELVHPEPAPAAQDNMNGWLEEDDEDEMEVEEDDEMNDEIEDDVDDAEIINPYEEADPLNRPPPYSDSEPKTTATPIGHATLQLLPPIRRLREEILNHSKMVQLVEDLSRQFQELRKEEDVRAENRELREMLRIAQERVEYHRETAEYHCYRLARVSYDPSTDPTLRPRSDDPYVMVRDVAADPARDDDDDSDAPRDPQPSQPRGSPVTYSSLVSLIMPPKKMTQASIEKLIADRVVAAIAEDRATRGNAGGAGRSRGNARGLEVANGKPSAEMKTMMKEGFCPVEEIQRMEIQLWNLRVKDSNIAAYTQRFNELVLLCPEVVPSEKKKIQTYIRGFPENVKGERTSSKPTTLNEAVRMAHTLKEQKLQAKAERVAEGNKRRWENNQGNNNNNRNNNNNNNRGNYRDNTRHHQYNNRRQGNARAMTTS
ncbi:putative reverse transcriptase domain-containing protein [Tanacetum coccineum]